ncbi:MAG: beta-glucosidase BglX [Moraxellaceae bacterium]|nr:MAG: beta-glucosidase BglX [Moraxellaceae bacterium]
MTSNFLRALSLLTLIGISGQGQALTDQQIEDLIKQMTPEEKAGQLNIIAGTQNATDVIPGLPSPENHMAMIKAGQVAGFFNINNSDYIRQLQRIAVEESRLKIPIIIAADVIHGYRTTTPLPLAEAASWDLDLIRRSARMAAEEAAVSGVNWTFAPMVDISRNPRWGRIIEGAGEDPFLGSAIARARVKGFQGDDLSAPDTIAATVKHFAAYGAPEAGREYNSVDMSERSLREVYLPPYKAALDAGAATVMSAFNTLNGVPAVMDPFLMRQILRNEWQFNGPVVTDYESIKELIAHGVAKDLKDAALKAFTATTDMDMMANAYTGSLPSLLAEKKITESQLNDAVRRILILKNRLGLFEDPYKYLPDAKVRDAVIFSDKHRALARDISKRSIVLLKNEKNVLPLPKKIRTLAVIGPMADSKEDQNSTWALFSRREDPVSILEGIKKAVDPKTKIIFSAGCSFLSACDAKDIAKAVNLSLQADYVIMALGEPTSLVGEDGARTSLDFPGHQSNLLRAIADTNKPVILLVSSGRPLTLMNAEKKAEAILQTWHLGTEAGNAIADVLFGDYNPSGKLPMSFPRSIGQVPLFYNHLPTGRPTDNKAQPEANTRTYKSRYVDVANSALYPFGYGLSYTDFTYSNLRLSHATLSTGLGITASVTLANTGKITGEEVVQLYISDPLASVSRPVKELKGFQKILLQPGESRDITFEITPDMLAFYKLDMSYGVEAGEFDVFIGGSSDTEKSVRFTLLEPEAPPEPVKKTNKKSTKPAAAKKPSAR